MRYAPCFNMSNVPNGKQPRYFTFIAIKMNRNVTIIHDDSNHLPSHTTLKLVLKLVHSNNIICWPDWLATCTVFQGICLRCLHPTPRYFCRRKLVHQNKLTLLLNIITNV